MPVVYEPVLFVHVAAAAVLVGSMLVEVLAGIRLRSAVDLRAVRTWVAFVRPMTPLSGAAWLLLLLSGGHLAGVRWSFAEGWITVSAVALLVAAAAGPLLHGRRLRVIADEAEGDGDGPVPTGLQRRILDPVLWASVHGLTGVAFGFILAMTNKTDVLGSVLALLVPGLLGVITGVVVVRTGTARSTATPAVG